MRKSAALEAIGLFLLIMSYIWIWRRTHPYLWIAMVVWLIASHFLHGESPSDLGFGRPSLKLFVIPVLAILAAGLFMGITHPAFLALLAYIPWGLLQQYLLNGYFLNRFESALPPRTAAWTTATLFAAAHLPNFFLMGVTFGLGWCSIQVYRRHRNLYFLGIAHATIGYLLYLTVPDSIAHHLRVGPDMLRHVQRAIQ